MITIRMALAAACIAAAAPVFGQSAKYHVYAQTCDHYQTRVEALAGHADALLIERLLDACLTAFDTATRTRVVDPDHVDRARVYLERLSLLRRTVVEMNMSRVFAELDADPDAATRAKGPLVDPVSVIGEYLIARDLGVISAYNTWARTSPLVLAGDG